MCFSTGRGWLLIYHHLRKSVSDLSADIKSTDKSRVQNLWKYHVLQSSHLVTALRVFVSTQFITVSLWQAISARSKCTKSMLDLWTEDMSIAIPCAMLFMDKGNSVMVYDLEMGKVWVLLVFTRVQKVWPTVQNMPQFTNSGWKFFKKSEVAHVRVPSKHEGIKLIIISSGNIGICPVNGYILVNNMTNGFDLYNSSHTTPLRLYVVPTTKIFTNKGVFGENGHTVVMRSDHGKVYVFVGSKTEYVQRLEHENKRVMVQAVEVKFSIFSVGMSLNVAYYFRQLL